VTVDTFFGVGMTEDATQKMAKFDDSGYDVIVFGEIYFANVRMLAKIKRYSENNPRKIILATGDANQVETIDLVSDQIDYESYVDHCIDTVFPNNIMLHENKCLRTQADEDTLKQLKEDIFNESIPIINTVKKYFKFASVIKTTYNIADRNTTCEEVAGAARRTLEKRSDYE